MSITSKIRNARGTSEKRKNSEEKILPGQLFIETDTNLLYTVDEEKAVKEASPINIADNAKLGATSSASRAPNDIFEENSNTVKNATNVTSKVNNKNISDIFEEDGVTVKKSTGSAYSSYGLEENISFKEGKVNDLSADFAIGIFTDSNRSEENWYTGLDLYDVKPLIKSSGVVSKGTEVITFGENNNKINYLKWTGDLILKLDSNSSTVSPSGAWNNIIVKFPHINFQGKDYNNTALGFITDTSYVYRPGTYYISSWGTIDLWTGSFTSSVYSFKGVWFPVDYNATSSSSYGASGGLQSYNPNPTNSTMDKNQTYYLKINNVSICFIQDRELL